MIVSNEITIFVKNKLMDAKYIMINEQVQEELTRQTEIFKQSIIELSETSSDYASIVGDLSEEEIVLPEKKKRGRKPKNKEVINVI